MKRILKHYIVDTYALYIASQIASGLTFEKGLETLLLAGIALTVASILAKPVINVLLLPLTLITFGLFKWVSSAIALYLVTLVVSDFKILGFHFSGLTTKFFDLPSINLSGVLALIGFSFLISLITSCLYWIIKS